jgi:hypothetical protein
LRTQRVRCISAEAHHSHILALGGEEPVALLFSPFISSRYVHEPLVAERIGRDCVARPFNAMTGNPMAFSISRTRDEAIDDLEHQVASLKRELAGLRRTATAQGAHLYDEVADRGAHAYDDVADIVADLVGRLSKRRPGARREIERQARLAGAAVKDHPRTTALVGLAVLGLAAVLLMRR